MLARAFRQNQPAVLLLLPVLVAALWPGSHFGAPPDGTAAPGMPLYVWLSGVAAGTSWGPTTLSVVLVLGTAFVLNVATNNADLFERRNHLPPLLFVLSMALMPQGLRADPALMGMPLVLWAMARVWSVQGRGRVEARLFDTGLLIGLAALCYLPYAFLLVVVWASLAVMRPPAWREYVLPAVALAVIFALASGVAWIVRPSSWHPLASLGGYVPFRSPGRPMPHFFWITLLAWLIAFGTASILAFFTSYTRSIMREKNTRSSFLALVFTLALLATFAWALTKQVPPVLVAVPAAVLPVYALLNAGRSGLAEIAVWCLLLLGLWARWAA
ncbi:MAG: hypothetical protein QM724_02495 [Flavobacteriales bacterium]